MARDYGFDPNADEDELDQDAMMSLLGGAKQSFESGRNAPPLGAKPPSDAPPVDAPVSTTMPVDMPPRTVTPAPARTPTAASVFQGFTPTHAMEGFDTAREQDTGRSAKDAFAYLANQAPPPPINDKAALGQWFIQYIQPGMNELGHQVVSSNGDSFRFKNWQGEYDVDFGRGAGAEGGALAWQAEDANGTPQTPTAYTPQGGAPTGTTGTAPALIAPPVQEQTPDTEVPEDALAAILAEIKALQSGGPSPMDSNALMQLLGGGS